jgi:hypothetical protein
MPIRLGVSQRWGRNKEIGHQWIVYADRQSIATCADETSALKLIAEDSAANGVTRKSRVQGFGASKNPRA